MMQRLGVRRGPVQRQSLGHDAGTPAPAPGRAGPGCQGDRWFFQYDGCSVPALASGLAGGQRGTSFDKDNPAGGSDTHFAHGVSTLAGGGACDRHDECYQSCGSDRLSCDRRLLADALDTCTRSGESAAVKASCREWAQIYFLALNKGGAGAFSGRQQQVCSCDRTSQGPAFRYPPPELLTRRGADGQAAAMNWLDYQLARDRLPLSAYRAFVDADKFTEYVRKAFHDGL